MIIYLTTQERTILLALANQEPGQHGLTARLRAEVDPDLDDMERATLAVLVARELRTLEAARVPGDSVSADAFRSILTHLGLLAKLKQEGVGVQPRKT